MKRTKIIATIGPASEKETTLKRLILAGVDVFRLNLSHGSHSSHAMIIKRIRKLSKPMSPIAIMADLQGPKLRTGELENGRPVYLKKGQIFTITTRKIKGNCNLVSTTYEKLPGDVEPGQTIFINDGLLSLKVIRTNSFDVVCKILLGGKLGEHKGINLPNTRISIPSLTAKDRRDLSFCLSQEIDYIALSFVRKADDIKMLKKIIAAGHRKTPVIAKIEKPEALKNIDSILNVADGIMVARGDLGVEMNTEEVPLIQKILIEKAAMKHKIVITATQMLESMTDCPRPTRAEASDIFNAILDGTDATMLSGETAIGKYPVKTVETMATIAEKAEKCPYMRSFNNMLDSDRVNIPLATASAAYFAVHESQARAILVFTVSGTTARLMSKLRPRVPVIAATPDKPTLRLMALYRGVIPLYVRFSKSSSNLIREGEKAALEKKLIRNGDTILVITGELPGSGTTNVMKILKVRLK